MRLAAVVRSPLGAVREARVRAERLADVRALLAARDDERPVTKGVRVAVIVGDSWAAGSGLDDPRGEAWSTRLGELMAWTTFVHAEPRTGFVNPGYSGRGEFARRLGPVLARRPEVVIVQGGLNDTLEREPVLRRAATAVLEVLAGVPEVLVVGPPAVPSLRTGRVDRILADVTAAAGRRYISTQGFRVELADGLHPTPAGHEQFARQVAAAVSGSTPNPPPAG